MNRRSILVASMTTALASTAVLAQSSTAAPVQPADEFPQRPIRIVHPYPGGPLDAGMRLLGERLAAIWRQPVIVDSRPGAGEIIAADLVAKSRPDGYTWLIATEATFVNSAYLYAKLPYDPGNDLLPVSELFAIDFGLIVRGDLPVTDVRGFVALAGAAGSKLKYASTGVGTGPHLAMESFRREAGFEILHIPYKAAPQAVQDLLGGQIDALFGTAQIAVPFLASGRLKMLAITGESRLGVAPSVPTFAESGFPGMAYRSSIGLALPKGTPPAIVRKIHASVRDVLGDRELQVRLLEPNGYARIASDPETFAATLIRRRASAQPLIRSLDIRLGE